LHELVKGTVLDHRGDKFPILRHGVLSQHESVTVLQASPEISGGGSVLFEANIWGMVFYAMRIVGMERGVAGIHLYRVVGALALFVRHAAKMLETFGYNGSILLESCLVSIRGVKWFYGQPGSGLEHRGAVLDDQVRFVIPTNVETLVQKPDRLTMDILRQLMFAVNWHGPVDSEEKLEELLVKGFNYNFWPGQDLKV